MFRTLISDKKKITVLISTVLFFLIAHGQCFAGRLYAHDYLLSIYKNDAAWQVALGRIANPFLDFLRGAVSVPWLIECLMLIWTLFSVYLTVSLFEIKNNFAVCLIAGIECCNIVFTTANASFIPWSDYYALSLFLSLLAAWLLRKKEKNKWLVRLAAILCLTVSLGAYQAYVFVFITVYLILFTKDLNSDETKKKIFLKAFEGAACLIIAGIIYFGAWKFLQKALGIWTADSYNGLAGLGDYSGYSFTQLIMLTYEKFINFFLSPELFISYRFHNRSLSVVWYWILFVTNLAILFYIPAGVLSENLMLPDKKDKILRMIMQTVCFIILPFVMNGICIVSKGMEHPLMIYPFLFVYIFAISLFDEMITDEKQYLRKVSVILTFALIIWTQIIISNQAYYKRNLQEEAAQSLMNRIVMQVEQTDGYIYGETPVAFVGNFENSPYIKDIEDLEDMKIYGFGTSSLSYEGLDYSYIKHVLNVNMNLVRTDRTDPKVKAMPEFPKKGSVAFINNILVVKIADDPQ